MDKYDKLVLYNVGVFCVYLYAMLRSISYLSFLQNPLTVFKDTIKYSKFKTLKEFEDGSL